MPWTLAHLSDPHIGPLPPTRARDLLNKRALGFLSWRLRRAAVHLEDVLSALVRDVRAQAPDHTVVTGDITNIALPEEFVRAAKWMETLGGHVDVSVVPGNHDAYVDVPWERSLGLWARYMSHDDALEGSRPRPPRSLVDFPFVRVRGGAAIIGVSTAQPMAPFLATGAVGAGQIARLEHALVELGRRGLWRVVLIHHPLGIRATHARKRLVDAAEVRSAIARGGAELVLHGHTHRASVAAIDSKDGPVPVIGAPSASASHGAGAHHYARYNLYRIESWGSRPRVCVEVRGLDRTRLEFVTERRFDLVPPYVDAPRAAHEALA
jgi:3',5'-cyclic AMP phosphodiesterase CpdA